MKIAKLLNLTEGLPIHAFARRARRRNSILTYILPYNSVAWHDVTAFSEWFLLLFSMMDFQLAFSEPDI